MTKTPSEQSAYAHIYNGGVYLQINKETYEPYDKNENDEEDVEYPMISLELSVFGNTSETTFHLDINSLRAFGYCFLSAANLNYKNYEDSVCTAKCKLPTKDQLLNRLEILEKEIIFTKNAIANYKEPEEKQLNKQHFTPEMKNRLDNSDKNYYKKLVIDLINALRKENRIDISLKNVIDTIDDTSPMYNIFLDLEVKNWPRFNTVRDLISHENYSTLAMIALCGYIMYDKNQTISEFLDELNKNSEI